MFNVSANVLSSSGLLLRKGLWKVEGRIKEVMCYFPKDL